MAKPNLNSDFEAAVKAVMCFSGGKAIPEQERHVRRVLHTLLDDLLPPLPDEEETTHG